MDNALRDAVRTIAEGLYLAEPIDIERQAMGTAAKLGLSIEYTVVFALGTLPTGLPVQPTSSLEAARKRYERERLYIDAHRDNSPEWRAAQLAALTIQVRLVTPWQQTI